MMAAARPRSRRIPSERTTEDHSVLPVKNAVCTVTNVFLTNIAGYWRNVSVLWCKHVMNISFTITVDNNNNNNNTDDRDSTTTKTTTAAATTTTQTVCKVELKPWHFWSKKGYKSFDITGDNQHSTNHRVELYWDLRSAKFSGSSPEPCSDYYLALASDEELVLLLGDYKKKAFKRTKTHPALVQPIPCLKTEVMYAKKSFATRARFAEGKGEHDVVVESSISGPKDPEMWISIDGIVLIHVQNLQWKFRGNETVVVNKQPIQILWDVFAWLFSKPGTGYGLFILKPGAPEVELERQGSALSCNSDSSVGSSSMFNSTVTQPNVVDFCLFLQAWKIE